MEKEDWKSVPQFEDLYEVSSHGRVRSIERRSYNGKYFIKERTLTPLCKNGYFYYQLRKDNKTVREYAHRLVAFAFIKNENKYPYINHINGKGTDNRIENLEWCTPSQNIKHAHSIGLVKLAKIQPKKRKAVIQFDLDNNELNSFGSIVEASNNSGVAKSSLCRCVKGKSTQAGGYKWKYKTF